MTVEIALTLGIILMAIILFATEKLRVDLVALLVLIAVSIFAILWFEVPFKGSAVLIFVGTGLFLLSTLGIGLFISTISTTQQQAMMTCFFFILCPLN